MDLRFTAEEEEFRQEVRAFIRDNLPSDIRERAQLAEKPSREDLVTWQRILNAKGWAKYSWPKDHGGPGWTPVQTMIFLEENSMAPAPELLTFNLILLGPVLMHFGTEAQKAKYLERAANIDDWWCQGFSEPGAGSDLASLRTTARREGDHYVINGQKTWTSAAHHANKVFLLARTDPDAPKKQQGISFLLVDDLKAPGITVRRIRTIDAIDHVNEVFFDDVRIPIENLVGEENKGWDIAKFLLGNERSGIARVGSSMHRLRAAVTRASEVQSNGRPLSEDPAFRQRVAQLEVDLKALEILQNRVISAPPAGEGVPDPLSSVLKIRGSEIIQRVTELVMDVYGPDAMILTTEGNDPLDSDLEWARRATATYLYLRAATIYGGSNEIQKNILAKTVLGLK